MIEFYVHTHPMQIILYIFSNGACWLGKLPAMIILKEDLYLTKGLGSLKEPNNVIAKAFKSVYIEEDWLNID